MNYYATSVRIDEETKAVMVKTLEITGESQSDFIKTAIIERCEKVATELERIRKSMDKFAALGLVTKPVTEIIPLINHKWFLSKKL